ncbi:SusC/RagA family TonB-linked outer membrane protein [Chitinophaga sp. NPDC101104]|uniref:SusC/RagA family TonB-linked outer membrane protein n=1 Tax=Chitinophaga sp. NPDC101104 TaxID=3390561 RepID=UPI003D08C86D
MKKCLHLVLMAGLAMAIALAAPYTASARAESQEPRNISITIQVKNKNMEEVFTEIAAKTGLSFHYDKSDLNLKKKINLNCVKLPLEEVLAQLTEQTGLKFTRKNNKIIVNLEAPAGGSSTAVTDKAGDAARADKEIRGKVKDANGNPLPGVTVVIKGTNKGTQTNGQGDFSLSANPGDVLVIRFLGFTAQEVSVGSGDTYDVVLQENTRSLNEIVVTALGVQRKAKELTYATQQLNNDDLSRVKDANVINSLAGKAAGVTINRSASGLGGSARVIMRGNKSTRENQPLYVIDGVPMANYSPSQPANAFGQSNDIQSGPGRDGGDGISNINPDDIESINILKGASAAAQYGSQAANGVIVITTKRGRAGRMRIDFSSDYNLEKVMLTPDLQFRYGQTKTPDAGPASWGEKGQFDDHLDKFFRTGGAWTNGISVSGGNEIAQSYFSYSNLNSKGVIPTSKFNRHTLNFRETLKLLKDRLSLDANVTFVKQDARNRPGSGLYYNPLIPAYVFPRGQDWNYYKDNFEVFSVQRNMMTQNWWNINTDAGKVGEAEVQNPYWTLHRNVRDEERTRAMASLAIKYQIADWLSVQARGNFDRSYDQFELKANASTDTRIAAARGRYTLEREFNTQMYGDLMLNFNKDLTKDLKLSGLVGGSITDYKLRDRTLNDAGIGSANGLLYPNIFQLANIDPASITVQQGLERKQVQALFASANLGYKDYLFLDLTGRNDWSSTFAFTPTMNKGYFYYSAGLTAVLSEMFKLAEPISFAKLRISYAKVGNDLPAYITRPSTYSLRFLGGAKQLSFNSRVPYPGEYIKPEDNRSFETGVEARFFNDRIGIDVTYYNNNNFQQYIEIPAPTGSGYATYYLNLGNIRNTGVEAMLTLVPVKKGGFTWTSNINFSSNRNKVVSLSDIDRVSSATIFRLTESGSNMYGSGIREGGQWGDIFVPRILKRDGQGRLQLDADGKLMDTTGTFFVGNPNPKFNLGWNNKFDYKNFTLTFLIDGRFGGKVMSLTQAILDSYGVSEESAKLRDQGGIRLDAVNHEGKAVQPLYNPYQYYVDVAGRDGNGDVYMYDATSIRLREISLSYKIPLKSKAVRNLTVGLIGRNLAFLKRDAPFDPEVSAGGDNRLQGVDVFGMPATRTFGASVKVGF